MNEKLDFTAQRFKSVVKKLQHGVRFYIQEK